MKVSKALRFAAFPVSLGLLFGGWAQLRQAKPFDKNLSSQNAVLFSKIKPSVAVQAISVTAGLRLLVDPNKSMSTRRALAWSIVDKVFTPVKVGNSQLPAWMTWYEEEDLEKLYRQMLAGPPRSTMHADVVANVSQLLSANRMKDLQGSLVSARFGKPLHQFEFAEFPRLQSHVKPGNGTIYYSPAYVQHLLENAATIAAYDDSGFKNVPPKPSVLEKRSLADKPFSGGVIGARQPMRSIAKNIEPKNLYALSMDSEMPPDAVMIKVNWVPAEDGATRWEMAGSDIVSGFGESQTGNFKLGGVALQGRHYDITDSSFITATDEHGKKWGLMGMHIASKNLRTWQWTSLVWGSFGPSHGNWEADQPASLKQKWPQIQNYGMVTASDFTEGDPAPYSGFTGKGTNMNYLGTTLKDISQAMGGYQWSANPYLEVGMSKTNCIGCHQGSPKVFSPRLKKFYSSNVGDFSFSITRNRDMFIRVQAEQQRKFQRLIRPSGIKVVKP